jgi:hypothetical protein
MVGSRAAARYNMRGMDGGGRELLKFRCQHDLNAVSVLFMGALTLSGLASPHSRLCMATGWSDACSGALERSIRSKKDIIIASCSIVSACLGIAFFISFFFFVCHRRYVRTVSNPEKGYWKHYGPFTLFSAFGSFASANAWVFQLKSLLAALNASKVAHTNDQHVSSFSSQQEASTFAVFFQILCMLSPPFFLICVCYPLLILQSCHHGFNV